jgi:hypothetical protein
MLSALEATNLTVCEVRDSLSRLMVASRMVSSSSRQNVSQAI